MIDRQKSNVTQVDSPKTSRRHALRAAAAALAVAARPDSVLAQKTPKDVSDLEQSAVDSLLQRFKQAMLPAPRVERTRRFMAIGTAKSDFIRQVLHTADETAVAYQRYLDGLRLPVKFNQNRMTIVVLANAGQYSKLLGEKKARNEGGHYDLDENWTVTFDHRGRGRATRSDLERANQVTLIHEITHQLSFNTGLLNIRSDVPMIISEGLATLAEPGGNAIIAGFGEVNQPRLGVMMQILKKNKKAWIPLKNLIMEDAFFDDPNDTTVQMAYAQSWLFWDTLVANSKTREKLSAYLQRIDRRLKAEYRLDDFTAVMGPVDVMERAMDNRQMQLLG